ncbi:hypothetical protein, partial [Collinsella aerofaciens]|uniref:hypothetical protein n=1 Tax=Collinsella aerofaciens TaxID=74426 RepID=UPI001E3CAB00
PDPISLGPGPILPLDNVLLILKGTSPSAKLPYSGNADVLAQTAKARQSEQGALKQGSIDLLIMPPKLKGRLPL